MDEIAIVKKQVQKAEWTERIRKCSESGLTVSEWCRENGINLKVPVKPSPVHKKKALRRTKSAEGLDLPDHSFQGITGPSEVSSLKK